MNTNKPFHSSRSILLLILVLLFSVSCATFGAVSATPTFSVDTLSTTVASTLEALTKQAPAATDTPIAVAPTATVPPAATATPTSTSVGQGTVRINFTAGATVGFEQGTVQPGQSQTFVLKALKSQPMIVSVDSVYQDVTMAISAQNGDTLLSASNKWNSWRSILPATQDYYIKVIAGSSAEKFTLTVTIPSRISFASGATSAKVSGTTAGASTVSYVLFASGGQTMDITLNPSPNKATLGVYGFSDGQPYLRSASGSTTFHMKLPSTQDYVVEVVPQTGQVVDFNMTVKIK